MKNQSLVALLVVAGIFSAQTATAAKVTMNMYREFETPGSWGYKVISEGGAIPSKSSITAIKRGNKKTTFYFDDMARSVTLRIYPQISDTQTFNDLVLIQNQTPTDSFASKVIVLDGQAQPRLVNKTSTKR